MVKKSNLSEQVSHLRISPSYSLGVRKSMQLSFSDRFSPIYREVAVLEKYNKSSIKKQVDLKARIINDSIETVHESKNLQPNSIRVPKLPWNLINKFLEPAA